MNNCYPHDGDGCRYGVPKNARVDTCTAAAGTLLLEFGVLSRLTDDPIYEVSGVRLWCRHAFRWKPHLVALKQAVARRATVAVWQRRDNRTGLLGSTIDVVTGKWIDSTASMGAGVDSYFEYVSLLSSAVWNKPTRCIEILVAAAY